MDTRSAKNVSRRLTLHSGYTKIRALFAMYFSPQWWGHVQVLLAGAILARGQRTVTAVLRVRDLKDESHFVKGSGLRWDTLMLLVPIPFAQQVWAWPFLMVLAPSERSYEKGVRTAMKQWRQPS